MDHIITKIQESIDYGREWQIEWSSFNLKGQMCKINDDLYLSFFMPTYRHLMDNKQFMEYILKMNAREFHGRPYYFAMVGASDDDFVFQLRLTPNQVPLYGQIIEEFLQLTNQFCYNIQYETPLDIGGNSEIYDEDEIIAQKTILCEKLSPLVPNFNDIFIYSPSNKIASLPLSNETPLLIQFNNQHENIPFSLICGYCDNVSESLCAKLLTANFHGLATNNGVLGFDGDDGLIVLNRIIHFVDETSIAQNLCTMLDYGEHWNRFVN